MPVYMQIIAKKLNYQFFQKINFGQVFLSKLNNYTSGVLYAKPREFYIRDFPGNSDYYLKSQSKGIKI